jgi:hypothetical protein
MTQLREALRAVGVMTVEERLRLIAIEVLATHAHSREAAAAALYARVCHDADLLAGLFAPYRELALRRLLGAVESEMRRYELAHGGGRPSSGGHVEYAPSERHGGGRTHNDNHGAVAPARPSRDAQEAVGAVLRLTMLDTFKIEGTPIGDMQAGAARAWARREGRHVRWVVMLTANMPAADPIRRWISADDADALWARSQEGDDA